MRSQSGSSTTVALDGFGRRELRAEARATGISERELLARSVRHYLERLPERRDDPAMRAPDLDLPAEELVAVEVPLPAATHSALSREAQRQGVPVERLAEHALYIELAGPHATPDGVPGRRDPVAAGNAAARPGGRARENARLSRRPS